MGQELTIPRSLYPADQTGNDQIIGNQSRGVTVSLTSQASFPLFIEERWSNVDYCELYTDVNTCNSESQYAMSAMIVVNYFDVHKSDASWRLFDVRKKGLNKISYLLGLWFLFLLSQKLKTCS